MNDKQTVCPMCGFSKSDIVEVVSLGDVAQRFEYSGNYNFKIEDAAWRFNSTFNLNIFSKQLFLNRLYKIKHRIKNMLIMR